MNNKGIKICAIIDAVLLVAVVAYAIAQLFTGSMVGALGAFGYVIYIVTIFVAAFAVYYILAGCKKDEGANLFKIFMNIFAVDVLITLFAKDFLPSGGVVLLAVVFASLVVLAEAKDLGLVKSLILSLLVLVCMVIVGILAFQAQIVSFVGIASAIVLGLNTVFMIAAKYADKKARGRHV